MRGVRPCPVCSSWSCRWMWIVFEPHARTPLALGCWLLRIDPCAPCTLRGAAVGFSGFSLLTDGTAGEGRHRPAPRYPSGGLGVTRAIAGSLPGRSAIEQLLPRPAAAGSDTVQDGPVGAGCAIVDRPRYYYSVLYD